MINDRPHAAFSLVSAPHLPLTGANHPLRREFERWLATGHAITLLVATVVLAALYVGHRLDVETVVIPAEVRIETDNFAPPPIVKQNVLRKLRLTGPSPRNEVPNPVAFAVDTTDIATTPGGGPGLDFPGGEEAFSTGDTLVVPEPTAGPVFEWFDELPVLITIEQPVYPRILREAGIDGTAEVRVRIGRNGRVLEASLVGGSPLLETAALACARTAVFKPALQGTRPVEVWIVIPIVFELHDRR